MITLQKLNGKNISGISGAFIALLLLSGCGLIAQRPTQTPIYITATSAPTDPPTLTPQVTDTAVLGPTSDAPTITWTPLATGTKTPPPTDPASFTPSFTPEFTETPTPKVSSVPDAVAVLAVNLSSCGTLTPNGFTTIFQQDKTIQAALGCAQSAPTAINSAVETFDSGTMLWASALADQPRKVIYVLLNNGSYQRYDDTWFDGTDPASTGENPPAGRKVPARGFGKVWHSNPAVHSGLGWAQTDEAGTSGEIQRFARGEMLYVASTNQIYIFAGGAWRANPTKF